MQNLKIRHTLQRPNNKDFYSLFYPAIKPLGKVGVVAQVISGLTEGILIYWLVTTNISTIPPIVVTFLGIVAAIMVVAILELGGRKFLQVLTRQVVWRKWQTIWHKVLFSFVGIITIAIVWQSFTLSTKGIGLVFTTQNTSFDSTPIDTQFSTKLDTLYSQKETAIKTLQAQHQIINTATLQAWNIRIQTAQSKVDGYEQKAKKGIKWAKSHQTKWAGKVRDLKTDKAEEKEQTTKNQAKGIATISTKWEKEIATTKATQKATIAQATAQHEQEQAFKAALFRKYALVLQGIIGLAVILAFICIVVVEIYHRGSEAKHTVVESETRESQFQRVWNALSLRVWLVAKKFADWITPTEISHQTQHIPPIGFKVNPNSSHQTTATQNTPSTPIQNTEILSMAQKNAKQFAAAYRAKNPTENNMAKLAEWESKVEKLGKMIEQVKKMEK